MTHVEEKIFLVDGRFTATCLGCSRLVSFATKAGATSALLRNTCRHCRIDYRAKDLPKDAVYKNESGKWCSNCKSCGAEQAYTRMDHAKTSHSSGWRCRACVSKEKTFSTAATGYFENIRVGWYKRFEVSAKDRNLYWGLSLEYLNSLWVAQAGRCALSGVALDNAYGTETVSIDRISSSAGYTTDNVQLVHKTLNLMKRNLTDEDFVAWCKLVAENFN